MPVPQFSPQQPIGSLGTVGDFWQWAMSDLLNNANRGVLAEFIVGRLLGLNMDQPRIEWDAYDLLYGGHKIEIKSSGYIQSWHNADSRSSSPTFSIGKRLGWDSASNTNLTEAARSAALYVFTLFPREPHLVTRESAADAVTRPELWGFLALRAKDLPDQKTISLNPLKKLCGGLLLADQLKPRVDALLKGL